MKITGDDLIKAAGELVYSGDPGEEDLGMIASRSRHVVDSAYLSPKLLGERTGSFDVTVPSGSEQFTWGARGSIDTLPPAEIEYWSVVDSSGLERKSTPNGRLSTLDEWRDRTTLINTGYPQLLYWQRDINTANQQIIRFYPAADQSYTLRLYAKIPPLVEVRLGETYDLPQGVASYLISIMAQDAENVSGMGPTPAVALMVSNAKRKLLSVGGLVPSRPTSPDWLDFDGRGSGRGLIVY